MDRKRSPGPIGQTRQPEQPDLAADDAPVDFAAGDFPQHITTLSSCYGHSDCAERIPTAAPCLPRYYPSCLIPQTDLILAQAVREFPNQCEAVALCRYDVVSELIPHFVDAIRKNAMAQDEASIAMKALVRGISNCNYAFAHRNSDYLFEQVMRTEEWLNFLSCLVIENNFGTALEQSEARTAPQPKPAPRSWEEMEITFLSDHQVEIRIGDHDRNSYNYAELGFKDQRNGNPRRAWTILCGMAKGDGDLPRPPPGKERAMFEKRIQEIRKNLREKFGVKGDPIPFNGNTYRASFKISCGLSFNT